MFRARCVVCFPHLHHLLFCFTQQQNLHQHKQTFPNKAKAVNGYPEDTHTDMERACSSWESNPQPYCCDAILLTTIPPINKQLIALLFRLISCYHANIFLIRTCLHVDSSCSDHHQTAARVTLCGLQFPDYRQTSPPIMERMKYSINQSFKFQWFDL